MKVTTAWYQPWRFIHPPSSNGSIEDYVHRHNSTVFFDMLQVRAYMHNSDNAHDSDNAHVPVLCLAVLSAFIH